MEYIITSIVGICAYFFLRIISMSFSLEDKVKRLEEDREGILKELDRINEFTNRRIDQEIDRTDLITKDTLSYIDSRVDKLEQKLTGSSGTKQVLKG